MKKYLLILFLEICFIASFSQKILDINYYSVFRKEKTFQIFNNSSLDYKIKGDVFYRTHKLVNMNDSLLVFDNDEVVKIKDLKAIRIKGMMISPYFFGAGAFFLLLDTGHNIAKGHANIINEQTILVSSIAIIAGLMIKRLQDKHIRIKKNVSLRVLDTYYQDLNIKEN